MAELAARQHGVVGRSQLVKLGFDRSAIDRRVNAGRLHPVFRAAYAVGHLRLASRGRWLAAVLAAGEGAVGSHQVAGAIWEILRWNGVPHVTVPRKLPQRPGLVIHRCRLATDEMTTRDGLPVTTVARTLLDLAAVLPRHRLERALREAEYRRYADSPSLSELLKRHRGGRGTATLRAILTHHRLGESITRSELEDRFLSLVAESNLPLPAVNMPVQIGGRWIEVDCAWLARRVIVELDGHAAHSTRRAFEDDRERDRLLQVAGWRVVRVTWRQLHERPSGVVADLRALLRAD